MSRSKIKAYESVDVWVTRISSRRNGVISRKSWFGIDGFSIANPIVTDLTCSKEKYCNGIF
jgi:hypothetical protein